MTDALSNSSTYSNSICEEFSLLNAKRERELFEFVMNKFKDEYRLNIIDRYEKDRSDYLEYKKDSVKSAIILASIILVSCAKKLFIIKFTYHI